MSTTYSFKVDIDPVDAKNLNTLNFQLAVQKTTPQSPISRETLPIQWLSIVIDAFKFTITWTERYQVFFTRTLLQEGAQIQEDSAWPAPLGTAWQYDPAYWSEKKGTGVGPSDVEIYNNLPNKENFGLAQAFTNAKGQVIYSPIACTPVFPVGGNVVFSPRNSVIVYFNQVYGDGVLTKAATQPFYLDLTPGVTPTIKFKGDKWDPNPIVLAELPTAPSDTNMWDFLIVFSGVVTTAVAVAWIIREINRGTRNWRFKSHSPNGTSITLQVTTPIGADPTRALEALTGEVVPDTTRTRTAKGVYKVEGSEVIITQVTPLDSVTSTIWNHLSDLLNKGSISRPRLLAEGHSTPPSSRKGVDYEKKREELARLQQQLLTYEDDGNGAHKGTLDDKQLFA